MTYPTLEPGEVFLGRYRVIAAVPSVHVAYWVEDTITGRQRRLDAPPMRVTDEEERTRFERALSHAARVPSPYVVELVDGGVDPESSFPYLISPRTAGESLADFIERRRHLDLATADDVLRMICEPLGAAHAEGILHGALDPHSIEIEEGDERLVARVRFLGLGRYVAQLERGGLIGYRAPELFQAPQTTFPATDVWALGVVVFEMLTGRRYFDAGNVPQVYQAVLVDPLPVPSERARELGVILPPGFDAWFAKCVARAPFERYAGAADAYAAFRGLVVRDKILDRRRQYIENSLGSDTFAPGRDHPQTCLMVMTVTDREREPPSSDGAIRLGTYRGAPEHDVSAQPCLMIAIAPERRPAERARSLRWILIALALLAVLGVVALLMRC